jgi:hypothetical protein
VKKELKQTLIASKVALVLLWPVSAWAATIAFGAQMAQIPALSILMTLILSTLMGATALLHAMKQEYEKAAVIPRLPLFVAYHMLSSNAAGLLMFFGAESWDIPTGYRAGAIMLAAFAGNQGIQRALQFFSNKYAPEPAK